MPPKKQSKPAEIVTGYRVEVIPIEDLSPYANNARVHSADQVDQIVASIREFGWTNPMLVDISASYAIVAGHGRLMAAKKLYASKGSIRLPDGRELPPGTVPFVDCSGWTEKQRRAYILADNKLAENATWDESLLKIEIGALLADDGGGRFDLSLAGFSSKDLASLLRDVSVGDNDPEEVPEVQQVAVSRPGDIWLLGDHRIICGDSTDATTVERLLAGAKPHLMVTDPPYGVEYDPNWRNEAARWSGSNVKLGASAVGEVLNDHQADWRDAWALFPGDVAYVWHAALRAGEVAQSLQVSGFVIRSNIVWDKTRLVIGRGDYHWQHEPCWYAVRKGRTGRWTGDRTQSTVWSIPKPQTSETGHGTQKPVECMKRPMLNNSEIGDAVYEPFSGSGTTIIAGEQTARKVYAVELNPLYVDVAVRRWQEFTGKAAILEGDGGSFADIAIERAPVDA